MSGFNTVWSFTGARNPNATTPTFPGGVFSSLETAESWIKKHGLSGMLTLYRVDVGAYDWAVENDYFRPSKPHHTTAMFIGQFSGGDTHYHYEGGLKIAG